MKSLQNYIDTYRSIANKLNISGDSAELLIQLLANASYISEVENIVYSQEASLDRATLLNSKIQKCVELMYSVYRGQCPRIILNIRSHKPLLFNVFDNIVTLNNLKLYYLGYIDDVETIEGLKNYESGLRKDTLSISAGIEKKIVCLIAQDKITKTVDFNESRSQYFVELLDEDISNDIRVFLGEESQESANITRHFSDHILNGDVFDLTIPGLSSRLYVMGENNRRVIGKVKAEYFKLSKLSSYNSSELKKISLKGVELIPFDETWEKERGITIDNHINTGILAIPEVNPESYLNIHYRANQNRYLNTIFRSNEDLGNLLKEDYPNLVVDTKVSYDNLILDNNIIIYYIPNGTTLDSGKIEEFINNRKSYYVTDNISILPGVKYKIIFDIAVRLYENDTENIIDNIENNILRVYENKFGINFINFSENLSILDNSVYEVIKTLISKISNVKSIDTFKIKYLDEDGNIFVLCADSYIIMIKTSELADFTEMENLFIEKLGLNVRYFNKKNHFFLNKKD